MRIIIRCVVALCLLAGWATPAAAQADASLNKVVSLDFENARAADVLKAIAISASLNFVMGGEDLTTIALAGEDWPARITIKLTDVRVRTALDAVCESAGCKWTVTQGDPAILKVTRTRAYRPLDIKANLSIHLKSTLFEQAFRTLASYLQMEIVIDGKLPVKSVTLQVKEGTTTTLLDALCKAAQCTWRIEPEVKRLVISAK